MTWVCNVLFFAGTIDFPWEGEKTRRKGISCSHVMSNCTLFSTGKPEQAATIPVCVAMATSPQRYWAALLLFSTSFFSVLLMHLVLKYIELLLQIPLSQNVPPDGNLLLHSNTFPRNRMLMAFKQTLGF